MSWLETKVRPFQATSSVFSLPRLCSFVYRPAGSIPTRARDRESRRPLHVSFSEEKGMGELRGRSSPPRRPPFCSPLFRLSCISSFPSCPPPLCPDACTVACVMVPVPGGSSVVSFCLFVPSVHPCAVQILYVVPLHRT